MAEIKYMGMDSLVTYDTLIKAFINGKIFVGTKEEYDEAYADNRIAIGALVILTDDENSSGSGGSGSGGSGDNTEETISTTAVLGEAVLGYMILGNV